MMKKVAKVEVIVTDESGNDIPFFSKTLTKEFKDKEGKKYKVAIQEPDKERIAVGEYTVQGTIIPEPEPIECPPGQHLENGVCIPDVIVPPPLPHECPVGQHWDETQQKCIDDDVIPPPPPPTGNVIYDSHIHSKLHDGKVRTVEKEGSISPGGLGVECRASGNPVNVVNADGTFSLICEAGHGRDYFYVLNYNSTIEIECAFWNDVPGQDLSIKDRSQHNEGPAFFGGYGLSIDRAGWGSKREPQHNDHDQSTSGKLPFKIETQKYFTIEFTVKDEGNGVRQTAKMNGQQFMNKIDNSPEPKMINPTSFAKQSYLWVRQNIDSGKGEIRIKRLRILKA